MMPEDIEQQQETEIKRKNQVNASAGTSTQCFKRAQGATTKTTRRHQAETTV